MPQYDYTCLDCKEKFTTVLTLREHESGKARCPKCKGSRVEQQPSMFAPVTTRKS